MKLLLHLALATLLGTTMLACAGGTVMADSSSTGGYDMPKWAADAPPELCAVGIQKLRGNLGAAKSKAENRARQGLSKQIESKVRNMIKAYESEGDTADGGEFSEAQETEVSTTLSKNTLVGSVPQTWYVSKQDKQVYSLVCLRPGVLGDAINAMNSMSAKVRQALAKRAEKADMDLKSEMATYDD